MQQLGQTLKDAMEASDVPIIVELDWTESITHPDERYTIMWQPDMLSSAKSEALLARKSRSSIPFASMSA